jgi:hypothetical protein
MTACVQDAPEGAPFLLLPACCHGLRWRWRRRVADFDARSLAEIAEMLPGVGRAGLRRDFQLFQCVPRAGGESGMRHLESRLAGADTDVNELQMTRHRPRRSECGLEQRPVRFATADGHKN